MGYFFGEIHYTPPAPGLPFGISLRCCSTAPQTKLKLKLYIEVYDFLISTRWKPIHWEYSSPFDLKVHSTLVWLGVSPDWRMPIDESPLNSISEKHADQFLAVEVESTFFLSTCWLRKRQLQADGGVINWRLLLNDSWTHDSHAHLATSSVIHCRSWVEHTPKTCSQGIETISWTGWWKGMPFQAGMLHINHTALGA